jgi:hypothetical protein
MIESKRIFHTCMLVTMLEAAMEAIGNTTGLVWATPWVYEKLEYWTPRGIVTTPQIRVSYSKQGPQHLELIEPAAGGFFDSAAQGVMHHVGVWSEDVGAEAKAMISEGWILEAAAVSPAAGYGRVAFLRPAGGGMLVELVTTGLLPLLQSRVGPTLVGPRS